MSKIFNDNLCLAIKHNGNVEYETAMLDKLNENIILFKKIGGNLHENISSIKNKRYCSVYRKDI